MGSVPLVAGLAFLAAVARGVEYAVPEAPRNPPSLFNVTTSSMALHWEPVDQRLSYPVDACGGRRRRSAAWLRDCRRWVVGTPSK